MNINILELNKYTYNILNDTKLFKIYLNSLYMLQNFVLKSRKKACVCNKKRIITFYSHFLTPNKNRII